VPLDSESLKFGKHYGLLLLCAAVLPLTLLAGFNYIIDPYQLLGAPLIDGVNARKTLLFSKLAITKPYTFYASDHSSLILGSSRAGAAIDPAHPSLAADNYYNYATPGARPRQDIEKLRSAIATRTIHKVIYSVDFFTFNSFNSLPEDYTTEFSNRLSMRGNLWNSPLFLQQVLLDYGTALWSYSALRDSIRTLRQQQPGNSSALTYATVLDNGLWVMNYTGQRKQSDMFTQMEKSYLQSNWFSPENRYFSFHRKNAKDPAPLEDFSAMLRLAHQYNIDMTVIILPVHARLLETLDYAGLWPFFEYWKMQLAAINEEIASEMHRSPFKIWDFNGYYPVATESVNTDLNAPPLQWMYDSAHTSVQTGDRILDIISGTAPADFGGNLRSENIDDWLLSQRKLRDAFRLKNPSLSKHLKNSVDQFRRQDPWTLSPLPASKLKIDKLADSKHPDQRAGE
jgi:hypothetical protein